VRVRPYTCTSEGLLSEMTRRVLVAPGRWAEALILRRGELCPESTISGPAIVEEPDSTTYVPPGFRATVDPSYCLILERE
jgi:N-methylhydantoinase A